MNSPSKEQNGSDTAILPDHPCYLGDGEYDHDFELIDDSFSHEFGTEICTHLECTRCGEIDHEDPSHWFEYDY